MAQRTVHHFFLPELGKMTRGSSLQARDPGKYKSIPIGKDVPLVWGKVYDAAPIIEALKAAQEIQNWFAQNELRLLKLLGSIE